MYLANSAQIDQHIRKTTLAKGASAALPYVHTITVAFNHKEEKGFLCSLVCSIIIVDLHHFKFFLQSRSLASECDAFISIVKSILMVGFNRTIRILQNPASPTPCHSFASLHIVSTPLRGPEL